MAKALPGPLVTAVSGTVGGVTFAQGKGGLTIRSAGTKCDPVTGPQEEQRSLWSRATAAWYALTDAQRRAWAVAAAAAPGVNSLGETVRWSAWQYWHHVWVLQVLGGFEPPVTPLPAMSLPGGVQPLFRPFGDGAADVGFQPYGLLTGYKVLLSLARSWKPVASRHSERWRNIGVGELLRGVVTFPGTWATAWWQWAAGEDVRARLRLLHADYAPSGVYEVTARAYGDGVNLAPGGGFETMPLSGVPAGWSLSSPMGCGRTNGLVDRYAAVVGGATLAAGNYYFRPTAGVSIFDAEPVCLSGYWKVDQGELTEIAWEHVPTGTLTHIGGPYGVHGWRSFYREAFLNPTPGQCRLCFRFAGGQTPTVRFDGLRVLRSVVA